MTIGVKSDAADEFEIPFDQITEISGINDRNAIINTWKRFSALGGSTEAILSNVISTLLSSSDISGGEAGESASFSQSNLTNESLSMLPSSANKRSRSNSMDTQTDIVPVSKSVIDLTSDGDNDEMQKAIAASLETEGPAPSMLGGQVITREDQDISRVLEASLADSKSGEGKKNSMWFFDHVNPYERRREDSWPVGLKNVGNTCWFNAVIQSLFHLENFRELVVNFVPSEALNKDGQIAVFMVELRRLFALMLASDRKYINPSTTIQILKQSFSSDGIGKAEHSSYEQQDVSEFQHKLLDWLEEAFQHRAVVSEENDVRLEKGVDVPEPMEVDVAPKEKDDKNAMIRLFYGKVKTFGTNAGLAFTTHTHFGQWPLYVAGYSDLHQSLEGGLAKGDIETSNTDQTSNQEQWFTHLPPLLTFELSRFSYNTMQSQAEKLHNKFSFPQTLFVDRYLEINKDEVREKRSKLWRLRSELSALEANLQKYTHYGSGEGKYPLSDVLRYTLDFASSSSSKPDPSCPVHAESASSQSSRPNSSGLCTCASNPQACSPKPKNIAVEELEVLTSCLTRWKEEVGMTIREYERTINDLRRDISQTYEQEHLKQHKYWLHAVMVHEGQAVSGHYWSYVCNRETGRWLKFNDVCVAESSWEEMVKESEGGYGTASAYCLIYVKSSESSPPLSQASHAGGSVARPTGQDFPSKDDALASLPHDLQSFVATDNQKLQEEMNQWDLSTTTVPEAESENLITHTMSPGYSSRLAGCIKSSVDDYAHTHAQSLLKLMRTKYTEIVTQYGIVKTWRSKLEMLVNSCFDKLYSVSQESATAGKLEHRAHLVLYLLIVYGKVIDPTDVKALIADQIARLDFTSDIDGWTNVQSEAIRWSAQCWASSTDFQINYVKWHQEYHEFRVVFSLFMSGLTLYNSERYEDALPFLHHACSENTKLVMASQYEVNGCNSAMKALDQSLLNKIRNQCLQRFNEMAVTQFESEDDYVTPLKVMVTLVLPILDSLQADDTSQDDKDFAGSIKDRWVSLLLDETMQVSHVEALKEFIGQLFESATNPAPTIEDVKIPLDLGNRYKLAFQKYCNGKPSS